MRVCFEKIDELEKWINDFVTADRYVAYLTSFSELVFVPLRSTRPLIYGYYVFATEEEKKKMIDFLNSKGVRIYNLKSLDWDETKFPGVRPTIEIE
jgi:hypothetical protein